MGNPVTKSWNYQNNPQNVQKYQKMAFSVKINNNFRMYFRNLRGFLAQKAKNLKYKARFFSNISEKHDFLFKISLFCEKTHFLILF